MLVVAALEELRESVREARSHGRRVGLVPTMGALHAGHGSLLDAARAGCDFVVTSIFVNPTQFGAGEDLERYPRPREDDLAVCRAAGVDVVFEPSVEIVYPKGSTTRVDVGPLADVLEGAHRPGHFTGVATIVLKLLNLVQPDAAYFGEKDFQQLLVIRRLCRDLDVPVEIVACPTVRESDGLALSSRNVYLTPSERRTALVLSRELGVVRERLLAGESNVSAVRRDFFDRLTGTPGVEVDYATVADGTTLEELESPRGEMVALVAARVGATRLIDNTLITISGAKS